jgi:hypothetical protein
MDNFVVYAYSRPNNTFYYIGKGRPNRPFKKRKSGVKPPRDTQRIHILHKNLNEDTAFYYERNLILFYGRKDLGTGLLQNRTDGGEGVSGWIPDDNWRKNKSKSMRGENNPFYGLKHTEESKKIIADNTRERLSDKRQNYFYGKRFTGKLNPMFGKNRPDLAERNKNNDPIKGTKWYNNGSINKRFKPTEVLEGFKLGRLKVH